jgi:hypothetical protein
VTSAYGACLHCSEKKRDGAVAKVAEREIDGVVAALEAEVGDVARETLLDMPLAAPTSAQRSVVRPRRTPQAIARGTSFPPAGTT